MNSNRIGRRTNFFWHPVLPHKCGVPLGYGTPHLCGSEEFCRAPVAELRKLPNETGWVEFKENNSNPEDLGEYRPLVSAQVDDPVGDNHVGPPIRDRERLGQPFPELDLSEAKCLGGLA